jgi:hypothetical protein
MFSLFNFCYTVLKSVSWFPKAMEVFDLHDFLELQSEKIGDPFYL